MQFVQILWCLNIFSQLSDMKAKDSNVLTPIKLEILNDQSNLAKLRRNEPKFEIEARELWNPDTSEKWQKWWKSKQLKIASQCCDERLGGWDKHAVFWKEKNSVKIFWSILGECALRVASKSCQSCRCTMQIIFSDSILGIESNRDVWLFKTAMLVSPTRMSVTTLRRTL